MEKWFTLRTTLAWQPLTLFVAMIGLYRKNYLKKEAQRVGLATIQEIFA